MKRPPYKREGKFLFFDATGIPSDIAIEYVRWQHPHRADLSLPAYKCTMLKCGHAFGPVHVIEPYMENYAVQMNGALGFSLIKALVDHCTGTMSLQPA